MPLLDMMNHSLTPNVGVTPYYDKNENQSFLVATALRDIEPNEQLCVSYGNLSNIHLAQKYGFTLYGQQYAEQDDRNTVQANFTFGEYGQILF